MEAWVPVLLEQYQWSECAHPFSAKQMCYRSREETCRVKSTRVAGKRGAKSNVCTCHACIQVLSAIPTQVIAGPYAHMVEPKHVTWCFSTSEGTPDVPTARKQKAQSGGGGGGGGTTQPSKPVCRRMDTHTSTVKLQTHSCTHSHQSKPRLSPPCRTQATGDDLPDRLHKELINGAYVPRSSHTRSKQPPSRQQLGCA